MMPKGNSSSPTQDPLVSIVIPVYNGSNYMKEAINSALGQTYKNVEVVLVNDGSTDNTESIAKSYGDKIRYFAKENGGVASALNFAIGKSKGQYISWLSHDDVYEETKIEKQMSALLALPKSKREKTIIYSNFSLINESSDVFFTKEINKLHNERKLSNPYYAIFNGLIHGCSLLIPRKCIISAGMFDEKLVVTQDYDLWFRMLPKYDLKFLSESLIRSRVHPNQGSKTIKSGEAERNTVWIERIKQLNDVQIASMSYTKTNFLNSTREHFRKANYEDVVQYLDGMIKEHSSRDIQEIRISIIIPFFNRIEWVKESLASAINQTHKNIEILLVDDNSTEDISEIIDIAHSDSRVNLLSNKHARGAGGARNTALDKASGEFVAFLDSDDIFEPNKLRKQLEFMIRNNLVATHTSYELFSNEKAIAPKIMNSGSKTYTYPEIISGCSIACPTVMIERLVIEGESIRFPEEYLNGQDVCFWLDVAKITDIVGIDLTLSRVRKHDSNVAYNFPKLVRGMGNINDYVIKNHLNESTATQVLKLTNNLQRVIAKTYQGNNIPPEHLLEGGNNNKGYKSFIKHIIGKALRKYHITYRALIANRERLNSLLMSSANIKKSNSDISNKLEEVSAQVNKLVDLGESTNYLIQFNAKRDNTLVNLNGSKILPTEKKRNEPKEYNITSSEFQIAMREFIAKTNTVLDIGVGLKPQIYFEPEVHICIEPFEQYRSVLRPFAPGRGKFIFLKSGALESIKVMDDNSVDSVFMLDLIEHLEKADGLELLREADRVSSRQIVVYTPLGFYPMHFKEEGMHDAWGLDGNELQEHKSGWLPEDFGEGWDFYICKDCHPAFLEEEKKNGVRYSALMAIKTKNFLGNEVHPLTPDFVIQRSKSIRQNNYPSKNTKKEQD